VPLRLVGSEMCIRDSRNSLKLDAFDGAFPFGNGAELAIVCRN
jgi:hypothetical protein